MLGTVLNIRLIELLLIVFKLLDFLEEAVGKDLCYGYPLAVTTFLLRFPNLKKDERNPTICECTKSRESIQQTPACSKSRTKTIEKDVKYALTITL